MLIFRGLHETGKTPIALTIGNFDGVHLGHQALLNQLKLAGHRLGLQTAVLVFEPRPKGVSFALHLEKPCHVAHALN